MDIGKKERITDLQVVTVGSAVSWICSVCEMVFGSTVAIVIGIREGTGNHVVLGKTERTDCCRSRDAVPLMFESVERAREALAHIFQGGSSEWFEIEDMRAVRSALAQLH